MTSGHGTSTNPPEKKLLDEHHAHHPKTDLFVDNLKLKTEHNQLLITNESIFNSTHQLVSYNNNAKINSYTIKKLIALLRVVFS